jgi:hypothetical protein
MGTIAIARPSTGYLKKRIPKCEGPEDPSHHFIREAKLFLKELSCNGKIQPAESSDQHDEDEDRKDVPSNVRWTLTRQFIPLSQHDRGCRLENRGNDTADETEKSTRDSADATSLFKVSQRLPTAAPGVNENAEHTIAVKRLFSSGISASIALQLNRN